MVMTPIMEKRDRDDDDMADFTRSGVPGLPGQKGMHMKTCSIWVSMVFLISIGLAVHWPLLSPIHTHEASISGNRVSGQASQGYRYLHHHRAVLHRDGSLTWYNVYPDTSSVKLQFNETVSFTPFRPLLVLSAGGIQQLEKTGGFAFLGIFTSWNLLPHFPLARIKVESWPLSIAGYLSSLDHPPRHPLLPFFLV